MPKQRITDDQLRDEIEQGLTVSQIADKYAVSRQAIDLRVKKLNLTTVAATLAPQSARQYVEQKLTAIEVLIRSLTRVEKLYTACEEWLRDPNNPDKYDINPRSEEVLVQYWEADEDSDGEPRMKRAKATLAELLRRIDDSGTLTIKAEIHHSDPRTLILQTAQETRQIVTAATGILVKLADVRAFQTFMALLMDSLKNADPQTAQRIAAALDDHLLLRAAEGNDFPLSA